MSESTASPEEIARFNALAERWWDPSGPMRPLHRMNPARIDWIKQQIAQAFPGGTGLAVLDIGCGAGIAAEALSRHGFNVLGIDAAPATIAAAIAHAAGKNLPLRYRVGTTEDLANEGFRFPITTALEVIEHVPDKLAFLRTVARVTESGGLIVLSTLNRTARSFLAAKIGAEYLLRWLPVGTHDWQRFVTPAELATLARQAGLATSAMAGLSLDLRSGSWRITHDVAVDYLITLRS
jgi:2-polyprenyl-6-hydroxyphenyl methylase / 3-demethylubiquinone-9 3-methyltransferase